jgi:hypothetical protein
MSALRVRPSLRLLCMGVGVLLLTGAVALWRAGDLVENIGVLGAIAGFFLLLGTVGNLGEEDETPGSARFHELADPARTLSPEDFKSAAREPVRPPRSGATQA